MLPRRRSETFIRKLITAGAICPMTGKPVYLEFCFLDTSVMATSVAAYHRFERKMNGD